MRRVAVLAFALIAGCLPGRDNPRDPVNRPTASLVIADWTPDGGSCEGVPPPPPGSGAVTLAPIAHCLVLDARGSVDANDHTAGLRYSYFRGEIAMALHSSSATFTLDESKFDLALEVPQAFSVT